MPNIVTHIGRVYQNSKNPSDREQEAARPGFLELFPQRNRSTISNVFLDVVRANRDLAPRAVLARAVGKLICDLADGYNRERDGLLLDTTRTHIIEAEAFAGWAVWWDSLPAEERDWRKSRQRRGHVEGWLRSQPATSRQLAYLRTLGHRGPVGDRAAASRLIDHLLAGGGGRDGAA